MPNEYLDEIFNSLPTDAYPYSVRAVDITVKDGLLVQTELTRFEDTAYFLDQARANQKDINGVFAYPNPFITGDEVDGEFESAASDAEEDGESIDEEDFRSDFTEAGYCTEYTLIQHTFPLENIADMCLGLETRYPLSMEKTKVSSVIEKVLLGRVGKVEGSQTTVKLSGIVFDEDTQKILDGAKEVYDEATVKRLSESLASNADNVSSIAKFIDRQNLKSFLFFTANGRDYYDAQTGDKASLNGRDGIDLLKLKEQIYTKLLQKPEMSSVKEAIEKGKKWDISYLPSHNLLFTTLDGEAFAVGPSLYVSPEELVLMLSDHTQHPYTEMYRFMFQQKQISPDNNCCDRILNGLLKLNPAYQDYDKVFDGLVQAEFDRLLNDPAVTFVNEGDKPYGLYTDNGSRFIPLSELESNQNVFHLCDADGYSRDDGAVVYSCNTEFVRNQEGKFFVVHGRESFEDVDEDCKKVFPGVYTTLHIRDNKVCSVFRYEAKDSTGKRSSPYNPVNHGFEGLDIPNAEFSNYFSEKDPSPVKVAATAAAFFKYRDYLKEQLGLSAS